MTNNEHFIAVALMIDDLRSDDNEARLTSMKSLKVIAATLGPERTRKELIPYITESIDDDDDVLKAMAVGLGELVHEVGGVPFVGSLLPTLEELCSVDEISVREQAVESLNTIAEQLFAYRKGDIAPHIQAEYMSLLTRMAESDLTACKISVSDLLAVPMRWGGDQSRLQTLNSMYAALASDEEIGVRRSACVALGKSIFQSSQNKAPLFQVAHSFAKDQQDCVRLQAVDAIITGIRVEPSSATQCAAALKSLVSDSSWRVRFMLSDRLGVLHGALPANQKGLAIELLQDLCKDNEAEVKASAIHTADALLEGASDGAAIQVLSVAKSLSTNGNPHVRSAVANISLKFASKVSQAVCQKHVTPLAIAMLEDEDSDVRLAVIEGFSEILSLPDYKSIAPTVLPVVLTLSRDAKWRVREVIVKQIPNFIKASGEASATTDMVAVCFGLLKDRVAAIRSTAATACRELAHVLGDAWAKNTLLPQLRELLKSTNYLHRVTLVKTIATVSPVLSSATVKSDILPMLMTLLSDTVPNVRMNAVWATEQLSRDNCLGKQETANMLQGVLGRDKDKDVLDCVKKALGH